MKRFFRRLFSRKAALILLAIAGGFATLFFAFHMEENWRGNRAWNAYESDAIHRGVRLYLKDYRPASIPDAENFASSPIFVMIRARETAGDPNPFLLPRARSSYPDSGRYFDGDPVSIEKWRDYFVAAKFIESAGANAGSDVLLALERFEPILQELREASARPSCRFPTKWDGYGFPVIPHLKFIESAASKIALRISAHLAAGESAAAHAELLGGLRIYQALKSEPTFASGNSRLTVFRQLGTAVRHGLVLRQWAEPELRLLTKEFSELPLMEDFRFSMETERAATNEAISLSTEGAKYPLSKDVNKSSVSYLLDVMALTLTPKGWYQLDQVLVNQFYEEKIAAIHPETGKVDRVIPANEKIKPFITGYFQLFRHLLAVNLISRTSTYDAVYLRVIIQGRQTAIACALERFYLAHQAYPEKLVELVPEYLASIPADVIDGSPMRYRRVPTGRFELWSIGEDRRDDNAKPGFKQTTGYDRDWIWRYPVPPTKAKRQ